MGQVMVLAAIAATVHAVAIEQLPEAIIGVATGAGLALAYLAISGLSHARSRGTGRKS